MVAALEKVAVLSARLPSNSKIPGSGTYDDKYMDRRWLASDSSTSKRNINFMLDETTEAVSNTLIGLSANENTMEYFMKHAITLACGPLFFMVPTHADASGWMKNPTDLPSVEKMIEDEEGDWLVLNSDNQERISHAYTTDLEANDDIQSLAQDLYSNDVEQVALELGRLSNYSDGWDGPRSHPADKDSFILVRKFFNLIKNSNILSQIEPTIFSVGTAALDIETERARMLLEFGPQGTIYANIDIDEKELDLEIDGFSGEYLPKELRPFF